MACRDNKYALGLSNGYIKIYQESSFQEQVSFLHDEPVRQLAFGTLSRYLASAGRKKITLWDLTLRTQMWSASLNALPLAVDFNEDDTVVMVATRANNLSSWNVGTGDQVEVSQFSDINEEDQSEYHYKRPPIRVRFALSLNVLGVAYRQRPISFWDLEDSTFVGQYHKAGVSYPEPLVHDFIFNPNPDICLAAVAYEGSSIAVFDPLTQHTIATLDVAVSSLAASPDGTTLATGSGDGIIKIFDFETLKFTCQISSYEQNVRALAFNSSNLRIIDIRGSQFNVWEPPILAYRPASTDDSGMDFETSVNDEPGFVATYNVDEDLTITAIATHHEGATVFCGRENGAIAAYSVATGLEQQALKGHSSNLAIVTLEWNMRQQLLLAVDRSGGHSLQSVTKDHDKVFHNEAIFKRSGEQIRRVMLSPKGDRVLVHTPNKLELLNKDGILLDSRDLSKSTTSVAWVQHPSDVEKLLLMDGESTRTFNWTDLRETTGPQGTSIASLKLGALERMEAVATAKGHSLGLYIPGVRQADLMPSLHLYPTQKFNQPQAIEPTACFDEIAKDIKYIAGTHESQLLYLNQQGWLCSLNIDDISPEKFYTRHFFIPSQWHSRVENLTIRVTSKGSVVLSVKDEIAVFHNGLTFEERVGCKSTMVSARASMRSVMKRGVSEP